MARFLLGAAGLGLACVLVVAVSSYTAQRATALLQQKLAPTDTWIGHTLNSQGYKVLTPEDHNDRTAGKAEPWSQHGQYGAYMNINDATINGFGCGPNGPSDCDVGTSPSQHFARKGEKSAVKQKLLVGSYPVKMLGNPKTDPHQPRGYGNQAGESFSPSFYNSQKDRRPVQSLAAATKQKLAPTDTWIGHTLNSQGYKFDPFGDHNDRTAGKAEPWSEHGQYGAYMHINDATINGFGCGPNGPSDCDVGTSPSQHFARRRMVQGLSRPLQLATMRPDTWNGLGYPSNVFGDNMSEQVTKNPWGEHGQYGVYMRQNDATINGFGCGPNGPAGCSVGTEPSQHYAVIPLQEAPMMRRRVARA